MAQHLRKQQKQPDGDMVYDNTGKVTGFEMEKANSGIFYRSELGLALTLATSYLIARQ